MDELQQQQQSAQAWRDASSDVAAAAQAAATAGDAVEQGGRSATSSSLQHPVWLALDEVMDPVGLGFRAVLQQQLARACRSYAHVFVSQQLLLQDVYRSVWHTLSWTDINY